MMEQIKKYIRGNKARGYEVIAELEKLGGKNILKLKGDEYDKVYYIERYKYTNANTIDFVSEKSFIGQLIVTHPDWEEIELPKYKYPKTYKECCEVLGLNTMDNDAQGYKWELIIRFQELLIARDAYWKIAEKMGLGKSWKPDWNNVSDKYCIYFVSGYAWSKECQTRQCPFAFPTPEMRDAFYENFKDLIKECKELL